MTGRLSLTTLPDRARLRDALDRRFGIDARALAAFRIILGCTLLFDVFHRSRDLVAFYTDAGAYPRALRLAVGNSRGEYSLHMLSGEPWVQAVLFGLAALLALALIVGYRTRLVTFLSLVLLVSVHFRNPLVLNGADRLLREVLLLGLFLPLGRRWAVDALGDDRESGGEQDREPGNGTRTGTGTENRVVTPATAAVLVYVVGFFANNGQHKRLGDTWTTGEALGYALRQDHMTILVGDHVVDYPLLLEIGTYGWLAVVVGAPLLLVLTGRLRTAYVGAFLGAVAGLGLSMAVGLFPAVLTAVLVLFLPSFVWDRLEALGAACCERIGRLERLRTRIGALASRVGPPRSLRSVLPSQVRNRRHRLRTILLGGVLIVVVLWTVGLLGYADAFEPVDAVDPDDNQWTMYAPNPSTSYGWYVVEADLESGEEMDVLRNEAVRDGPPAEASDTLPSFRWRKYMNSLDDDEARADRFGTYMCDRAADQFDAPVERVEVTYHYRSIEPAGDDPTTGTVTRVETVCSAT
ncbi:HTTM domain-containing protein [Haloterrigena salina JCM 13891]|uniref:HTTM domain-containing protein n=1 Tax=Haloterrigena salina JCM 13891 TaxID=1227488 RepID=M0BZX6_9EURY|nr:HTTM domain-containing protein [Haloterrigena salina]ELZ15244.1 HTTM domain-containing protein [Haloterrigena salina JCM 13891]